LTGWIRRVRACGEWVLCCGGTPRLYSSKPGAHDLLFHIARLLNDYERSAS